MIIEMSRLGGGNIAAELGRLNAIRVEDGDPLTPGWKSYVY